MIQPNPTVDGETDNSASTLGACSVTLHCREPQTEVASSNFENLGRAAIWKCNKRSWGSGSHGAVAYYEGGDVPKLVWDVPSNSDPNAEPDGM
jgi:hypothetical protein